MHLQHYPAAPPLPDAVPWPPDESLWLQLLHEVHDAPVPAANAFLDGALHCHPFAGWQLQGVWPTEAQVLFDLFKPLLDLQTRTGEWVVAQLGQSLDGCVATRTGDSQFINGPDNIRHLHRLRALSDAVLIGAGSVAADDPQLTTRHVPGPNPVRVLLDPRLGLEALVPTAKVFVDREVPTLWLTDARWGARAESLVGRERTLAVDGLLRDDGTPELSLAVAALRARGLKR
ncbi:MAG: RibD family protein, partial [Comamonadaceae bacterium]